MGLTDYETRAYIDLNTPLSANATYKRLNSNTPIKLSRLEMSRK